MSPVQNAVNIFFMGLIMSGIPMIFQGMALKLDATTDNKKLGLSKLVGKAAFIFMFGGIAGLIANTILIMLGLWAAIPKA
jgi:hypothetical protein